jgi:pimeloyl-ACP methyl ester carboxylesterase
MLLAQPVTLAPVTLASGLRLNVAQRGPHDGRAVLMLHGYSDSWFSFSRVLPHLPEGLRVIVPDQRGHGDSDRPHWGYGIDDFATDALDLLNALAVEQAVVVGHSLGTLIARRVAERAPDRVTRLVLVNGALSVRNDVVSELRKEVSALTDPVDPAFVRAFQSGTIVRPVPREFLERIVAESRKLPARVWKAVMAGMWDDAPEAQKITCPTVLLGGDQDAVFSVAEQQAFADAIPGARLEIFDGYGHALPWEEPKAVASAIAG